MSPIELDKTNDIKVLIILLKCSLKPGDLCRLTGCISHLIQDIVPLQAVLLDVLVMVCRVQITPELVLRAILAGVPELCIDAVITAPEHHGQGRVLQRSCNSLAACAEVSVTEGVESTTHEVYLEVCTEEQQICKVDSAGTVSRTGNRVVRMCHHQAINALTALPHLLAGGCETKLDLEHCVPDFLVLTSTVVHQFLDLRLILGLADTKPVVTIIRATDCPIGISQLLVPLINSERRALNKHHDVRCLVHDEAQPWRNKVEKSAEKFAGNFLKFARPQNIYPNPICRASGSN